MIRSELTRCHATHTCQGCDATIPHDVEHLDHTQLVEPCQRCDDAPAGTRPPYHSHVVVVLSECLACARRNGRPEVADPSTGEQPLDLEGIA